MSVSRLAPIFNLLAALRDLFQWKTNPQDILLGIFNKRREQNISRPELNSIVFLPNRKNPNANLAMDLLAL